ncbi:MULTISPECIES: aminoglycoside phosphotransferase [unclassified Streptomyces]|uniref:aminoglycoside phosphotransferase n=1 Tax=unclassified Streptomyces TaxID=2593676 RepID=UPI001660E3DC|nr:MULTISPECIES: aminoglycoside phosphotransferase [unclassified Streptomyces]MBD0710669.1 hypothetical protein [Streptomyces sp. CBMA291]MBD0715516.1 hypothetical protein [Streptomyces sp. CBMA370]
MRVTPRAYGQLPDAVRRAVAERVGEGRSVVDVTHGTGSGFAALLSGPDGGKTFVKGLPEGHERMAELDVESGVAPFLPGFAPRLLWRTAVDGWTVLAFEGIAVTSPWADFDADDSPHLESVTDVLRELSTTPAPPGAGLKAAWERWRDYCDPADEPLLTGDRLVHGDPAATNFLPGTGRTWLIDWAWAARGPGWVDTVLWGQRLVLDGEQTPEQAARWCARVPAFAQAPRAAVAVLAEADARSWEAWQAYGMDGLDRTVTAARAWADHLRTP